MPRLLGRDRSDRPQGVFVRVAGELQQIILGGDAGRLGGSAGRARDVLDPADPAVGDGWTILLRNAASRGIARLTPAAAAIMRSLFPGLAASASIARRRVSVRRSAGLSVIVFMPFQMPR